MDNAIGKGTLYLMIANFIFMVSGYLINLGLGRYLGPSKYGIFGIILSLLATIYILSSSGFPTAISKFISENKNYTKSLIKKSLSIQFSLSLILFILYFIFAPFIADVLQDKELVPYIKISALAIPFHALNSIYNWGFLNGFRLFDKQAKASIGFSLSKIGWVFLLVFLGYGVTGAVIGYIASAAIGFLLGLYYTYSHLSCNPLSNHENFPFGRLLNFSVPIILYAIFIFLIFNIDLLLVKAILHKNIDTGYYTAATVIARAPYLLFSSLALTLLPSISYLFSKKDLPKTQNYITKSFRYMIMLLLPSILLISATAKPLVKLLYTNTYEAAGEPLMILAIGLGFLTIFNVLCHIAMGSGKPIMTSSSAFLILLIALILNTYLIPSYGLKGAAIATTIASALGLLIMAIYIYRLFGVLMNPISFAKIVISSLIIFLIAYFVQLPGLLLMIEYAVLFTIYVGILWVIKEIKKEDIETLRRIIPINISGIRP